MNIAPGAARDFDTFGAEAQGHFVDAIKRFIGQPGKTGLKQVPGNRFMNIGATHTYRASRELRVLLSHVAHSWTVVGLTRRNNKTLYRSER